MPDSTLPPKKDMPDSSPSNQPSASPASGKADASSNQIQNLEQQLYAREESDTMKQRQQELKSLGIRRESIATSPNNATGPQPLLMEKMAEKRAARRKRIMIISGAVILLGVLFAVGVGGTLWYRSRYTVEQTQIQLAVTAPAEFTAGDAMTYTVTLRNDSFVDWENVELLMETPETFLFEKHVITPASVGQWQAQGKQYRLTIGALASKEQVKVKLDGQLLGEQNATLVTKSEVVFTPANFPSGRFTKTALVSTTITNVPVGIAIDATDEAQSGERAVVTMSVRNDSSRPLQQAYLKLTPSEGMQFVTEDPATSAGFNVLDSLWEVGTIEPLATVERKVVILVEGQAGERKTLDVEVGIRQGDARIKQRLQTHVVTITASALTIEQVYNDQSEGFVVIPGEAIKGVIKYSNIGTGGLKNAVIKVTFEGNGLDVGQLKLNNGGYNPTTRTISWTSSTVPALATLLPQQSGEIEYDFAILPESGFPTTTAGKNNNLVATATIDSPDLITPTGEKRNLVTDRLVLPVATTFQLEAIAFYDDGRIGLKSDGPIPPKVGQQTTYTVRLRLGSSLNDVGDVRVVAVLPDGVRYTNKVYKTNGEVGFNERTGEITWTLPSLTGLSGRAAPAEELHFQVAVTPGENQIDQVIELINKVTASGTDLFTDTKTSEELTTFPDTETAVPRQGKVVP